MAKRKPIFSIWRSDSGELEFKHQGILPSEALYAAEVLIGSTLMDLDGETMAEILAELTESIVSNIAFHHAAQDKAMFHS